MSISGIATFLSSAANTLGASSSLGSLGATMSSAEASLGKGLAAIANGQALDRVDNQLTSEIQSLLTGTTATSTAASTTSTASTKGAPATGTGNVTLSVSTPLSTLGIPKGGSVYVSAGGNTTTYTSTGSDTVGDLLSTINTDLPDNAQVSATLNSKGRIVLTSKNTKDTVSVSGVYARNIGFAVGNQTFKPTQPTSSGSGTTTSSTKTSSTTSSSTTSKSTAGVTSAFTESATSAATLLVSSGASGSLVNLIA